MLQHAASRCNTLQYIVCSCVRGSTKRIHRHFSIQKYSHTLQHIKAFTDTSEYKSIHRHFWMQKYLQTLQLTKVFTDTSAYESIYRHYRIQKYSQTLQRVFRWATRAPTRNHLSLWLWIRCICHLAGFARLVWGRSQTPLPLNEARPASELWDLPQAGRASIRVCGVCLSQREWCLPHSEWVVSSSFRVSGVLSILGRCHRGSTKNALKCLWIRRCGARLLPPLSSTSLLESSVCIYVYVYIYVYMYIHMCI